MKSLYIKQLLQKMYIKLELFYNHSDLRFCPSKLLARSLRFEIRWAAPISNNEYYS